MKVMRIKDTNGDAPPAVMFTMATLFLAILSVLIAVLLCRSLKGSKFLKINRKCKKPCDCTDLTTDATTNINLDLEEGSVENE